MLHNHPIEATPNLFRMRVPTNKARWCSFLANIASCTLYVAIYLLLLLVIFAVTQNQL